MCGRDAGEVVFSEIALARPRPTDDRPDSGVPTGCLELVTAAR